MRIFTISLLFLCCAANAADRWVLVSKPGAIKTMMNAGYVLHNDYGNRVTITRTETAGGSYFDMLIAVDCKSKQVLSLASAGFDKDGHLAAAGGRSDTWAPGPDDNTVFMACTLPLTKP